jgi:hypothetical protein
MKATTCSPLNSMTVKGSNGSSRYQLLNPSIDLPLDRFSAHLGVTIRWSE